VINLTATITPECKLTSATVENSTANINRTGALNGSSVTFNRSNFTSSSEVNFRYETTPNLLCRFELTTEKGGMTDGLTNGNNWRNYQAQLINGTQGPILTTTSGNAAAKITHEENSGIPTDHINVLITFPATSGFTPNVGTYTDKLTLRIFTN
jgi:hypothetical protein